MVSLPGKGPRNKSGYPYGCGCSKWLLKGGRSPCAFSKDALGGSNDPAIVGFAGSNPAGSTILIYGELAERLKASVLKTEDGSYHPWVRIPHSPP